MPFIRLPTIVKGIDGAPPGVPGLLLKLLVWADESFDAATLSHDEIRAKLFPNREKPFLYFTPCELLPDRLLYAAQFPLLIQDFNVLSMDLELERVAVTSFEGSTPTAFEEELKAGSPEELHAFVELMGDAFYHGLVYWGIVGAHLAKEPRVHIVCASGCCMSALIMAGKHHEVIVSLFFISPLLNDLENEDILHDFSDCRSVWHDARSDARDMFGANDSAAGQAEFEKNASRLCLPLSVTDGLRQYMLHDHPWPPHVSTEIMPVWRDRWVVSPLGGAELIQTTRVLTDRGRSALTEAQWKAVKCKVVLVQGLDGQPEAEEKARVMKEKLTSVESFEYINLDGAPLMAQMARPDEVNIALAQHLFAMEGLDTSQIPARVAEARIGMQSYLGTRPRSNSKSSHGSRRIAPKTSRYAEGLDEEGSSGGDEFSDEDTTDSDDDLIQIRRPERPLDVARLAAMAISFDEAAVSVTSHVS